MVEKSTPAGVEKDLRDEALRGALKEAHSLFVMFHPLVVELLAAEAPFADQTQRALREFFTDFLLGMDSPSFYPSTGWLHQCL